MRTFKIYYDGNITHLKQVHAPRVKSFNTVFMEGMYYCAYIKAIDWADARYKFQCLMDDYRRCLTLSTRRHQIINKTAF